MIKLEQIQLDSIITAINSRAKLASPTFTGTPIAPTAVAGTNTTQIATTAFVLANSVNTLATDLGLTATATELNFVDGVTSAIQTQLNDKAALQGTATVFGGAKFSLSGSTLTVTTI